MPQEFARRGTFTNRSRTLTIRGEMSAETIVFVSNKIVQLYSPGGWGSSAGTGNILGSPIAAHGGWSTTPWYLEGLVAEHFQPHQQGTGGSYITNGLDQWDPDFEVTGIHSEMDFGYTYYRPTPYLENIVVTDSLENTFPLEIFFETTPGNPPPAYFDAVDSITWSDVATIPFSALAQYQVTGDEVFDPHRLDMEGLPAPRNADWWELPRTWTGSVSINSGELVIDLAGSVKAKWGTAPFPHMPYRLATAKWRGSYLMDPAKTTGPASQHVKGHFYHVTGLGSATQDPALPDLVIAALDDATWASSIEADIPMGSQLIAETRRLPVQEVDVNLKARQIRTGAVKAVSDVIVEGILVEGAILYDRDAQEAEAVGPPVFPVTTQTVSGSDPGCTLESGGVVVDYNVEEIGGATGGIDYAQSEGPQPDRKLLYVQARFPWEEYREVSGMWKARLFTPWDALRMKQVTRQILPGDGQTPPFTGYWSYFRAQSVQLPIPQQTRNLCHKRVRFRMRSFNRANVRVVVDFLYGGFTDGLRVSPLGGLRSYTITTGAHNEWVERTIDITLPSPTGTLDLHSWDALVYDLLWVTLPSDQPSPTWRVDIEKVELLTDAAFVTALDPAPGLPHWQSSGAHGWPPDRVIGPLHASQGGWPSWHPIIVPGAPASIFDPEFKPRAAARTIQEIIEEVNRSMNISFGTKTPYNGGWTNTAAIEQFRYSGWSATNLAPPRSNKPNTNFTANPDTPYDQTAGYTAGSYNVGTTALPWAYTDLFDNDAPAFALGGDGLIVVQGGIPPDPELLVPVESGPQLVWSIDVPATGDGALVRAQYVGQSIRLYPGCGNIGAQATLPGSFGATTTIDFWAILEGEAAGQIIGAEEDSPDIEIHEVREHDGSSVVDIDPPRSVGTFAPTPDGDGQARCTEPLRGDRPNSPNGPLWDTGLVNLVGEEDSTELVPVDGWEVWPPHRLRRWLRFWYEPGLANIALVHSLAGHVLTARVVDGDIQVKRWDHAVFHGSPAATVLATTGANNRAPSMERSHFGSRIELLFIVPGSGAMQCVSDDDGATWSEPTMAFANAVFTALTTDNFGGVLRVGMVPDSTGYLVQGTYQGPGDASPSAVFTVQRHSGSLAALRVKKVGFGVQAAPFGTGAILMTCVLEGDTDETNLVSYDEGRTFKSI